MKDDVQIPLPRVVVFEALNATDILKEKIPGCEELTRVSEAQLEAKAVVKFGPVKASFNNDVEIYPAGGRWRTRAFQT